MRLSPNFSLSELTNSATAAAQGLPNTPDIEALANLSRLATTVLEPVRALLGVPCSVTSGYRSPAVNAAIPEVGATHSAHQDGRAADIVPKGVSLDVAFDKIRASDIPYDQCIKESLCLHLSIAREGEAPRGQTLVRGGTAGNWTYEEVV